MQNKSGSGRRGRVIAIIVVILAALGALVSGSSGTPTGIRPVKHPAAIIAPVGGVASSGSSLSSDPVAPSTTTDPGLDQTTDPGLDQNDWNQICTSGCNPGDGLPTYQDGGGLALPGGGD
ncbi:MAG TPA: hypothetical protein VN880_16840 [Solirubrobacteraceae bacterium]|jgi:hypothetical protein|nr:hypothetical protein [Solirubrobacteraceae bacterium]